MDGSQQPGAGFPPHIQQQLREAAMTVPTPPNRGRGQNWRGRNYFHGHQNRQAQARQYAGGHQQVQPQNQAWGNQPMTNPIDSNAFPPLGSIPSQAPTIPLQNPAIRTQQSQPQPQARYQNVPPPNYGALTAQPSQDAHRSFPVRGRGGQHRGRGYNHSTNDQRQHAQSQPQNPNDFQRPPPAQRRLFTGAQAQFQTLEEQRLFQRRIMDQSDFLNHLANQSLKNQLTVEEQQEKELFRKELEAIAQKVIADAHTESPKIDPSRVQLKLYGSLGSGFGVAGSDMDLLLAFPQNEGPLGNIEIESRRMLEKALLDAGIGARLLTNTRVPILRVCQKPNPELLKNLRECRSKWEQGLDSYDPLPAVDEGWGPLPILTDAQIDIAAQALYDLDSAAHEVPLPASPQLEHAKLEYVGDCGIQCDINFSNYVALHNTRLLKAYGSCDSRVRQVGVFVKSWAKTRDINTPYRGTLSSYGYILMVLHYLMHIVNPPLIPNLQEMAKQKDSWEGKTDIQLVEGFDVRFIRDPNEIQKILQDMPRNHESVGSLLRGFFWYYADPRGFHWNQEVVSFRSQSGRLSKRSKGWTEAKWSESKSHVRLRYLLAIEDPFEIDHNVGRTVGHSGIVAIRDEFRRAWAAIDSIKFDDEARIWYWANPAGKKTSGDELMSVIENRGDLLRKDQDYHKQRVRQMRQELEVKEKSLQETATQGDKNVEEREMNGTLEKSRGVAQDVRSLLDTSSLTLINNNNLQVKKSQPLSNRRVLREDDDDEEEIWTTQQIKHSNIDWDRPFNEKEVSVNAEWVDSVPQPEGRTLDWDKPFNETEISINAEWIDNTSKAEETNLDWPQVQVSQPLEDDADADADENGCDGYEDTGNPDLELKHSYHNEDVKIRIGWDVYSKAGRWLRWRDGHIRKGDWTGASHPCYQQIDQAFPYDPDMTIRELAVKNKSLRTLYPRNSYVPKTQIEQNRTDRLVNSNSKTNSESSVPVKRMETVSVPTMSGEISSLFDPKTNTSNRHSSSTMSKPKKKRNPRRRRKTSSTMKESTDPTHLSAQSTTPHNVQDYTNSGHTSETINPTAKELLKLFRSSSPPCNVTEAQPVNTTITPTPEQASPSNPQSQANPEPLPLVPLTLYPNHSSSTRPRDEDPNIMPIPRSLNFQFDPRQLADLEVIRRGGNGCARYGNEFDIEIDYEFGGAGEMAGLIDGGSEGSAEVEEREEVWDGKGDVEGLLGELPGWIDD